MRLKLGDLYVKSLSIDSYDNEIQIDFTSLIEQAKNFDILTKRLIELSLQCSLTEVIVKNKDKEESE